MSRRKISNLVARKKKQKMRQGLKKEDWIEWCERRARGKRIMLKVFAEFFKERIDEEKAIREADEGLSAAVSSEGPA